MGPFWKATIGAIGLIIGLFALAMSIWWADAWVLSAVETVTLLAWLAGCVAVVILAGPRRAIACGAVVAAGSYWLLTMGPWFSERIGPTLVNSEVLRRLDSWARGDANGNIHYVYSPAYALNGHWGQGWGREEPQATLVDLPFAQGAPDPSISQAVAHWSLLWAVAGAGGLAGWLLHRSRQEPKHSRHSISGQKCERSRWVYGRFSLRQLLGLVTFAAFACGMLLRADHWGARIVITSACFLLVMLLISLLVSQQQRVFAGGWLFFSITYLAAVLAPWASLHVGPKLLTSRVLAGLESRSAQASETTSTPISYPDLNPNFKQSSFMSTTPYRVITFEPTVREEDDAGTYSSFQTTGHWLLAMAIGYAGGLIASCLAQFSQPTHSTPDD